MPLITTQIIVNRPKKMETLDTEFSRDIDVMHERTTKIPPTHSWQYKYMRLHSSWLVAVHEMSANSK